MVASELAGSKIAVANRSEADACAGCPLVTVMVCRKCEGSDKVVDYLEKKTRAKVTTVRCQKVCKGPVAALVVRGRMEYFGKLKKTKRLQALGRLANVGSPKKVPKPLKKVQSKECSGRRVR